MILSTEEIRRWCRAHTRRGQSKYLNKEAREFATMAFLRHIGFDHRDFYRFVDSRYGLTADKQRVMSRFIEDWEAGLIEFSKGGGENGRGRKVVHLSIPRKKPSRGMIDFTGTRPKLFLVPRRDPDRMPSFPSVAFPTKKV